MKSIRSTLSTSRHLALVRDAEAARREADVARDAAASGGHVFLSATDRRALRAKHLRKLVELARASGDPAVRLPVETVQDLAEMLEAVRP